VRPDGVVQWLYLAGSLNSDGSPEHLRHRPGRHGAPRPALTAGYCCSRCTSLPDSS
jgi:hypothetical protein